MAASLSHTLDTTLGRYYALCLPSIVGPEFRKKKKKKKDKEGEKEGQWRVKLPAIVGFRKMTSTSDDPCCHVIGRTQGLRTIAEGQENGKT